MTKRHDGGGFTQQQEGSAVVERFVEEISQRLGEELQAVYRFGSSFARGPKGPSARVLVLVRKIDAAVLADAAELVKSAHVAGIYVRLDTPDDVLRSADVFPVFALELLDTKELMWGSDVLAALAVCPAHLRGRIEQSLRVLHRDLIRAYLESQGDGDLAHALRLNVRKSVYLLRALALVCRLELSGEPTVEEVVEVVTAKLLPEPDRLVWHGMRRFAGFAESLEHPALVSLYGDSLAAFSTLIDAVDAL